MWYLYFACRQTKDSIYFLFNGLSRSHIQRGLMKLEWTSDVAVSIIFQIAWLLDKNTRQSWVLQVGSKFLQQRWTSLDWCTFALVISLMEITSRVISSMPSFWNLHSSDFFFFIYNNEKFLFIIDWPNRKLRYFFKFKNTYYSCPHKNITYTKI